jgi:glycosyltransferase involved in cell wall biosynthesis
MRIAQIAPPWLTVPPARYGGTERVVSMLTEGLMARGHEVTLFASGGSSTGARLVSPLEVPPAAVDLGNVWDETTHVLAAYRRAGEFDVIHDHTEMGPAVGSLLGGPPVVHTLHQTWTPQTVRLFEQLADSVHLVAISHAQAVAGPDVPLAGVVHHGLDLSEFRVPAEKEDRLIWVGRASPDKGPVEAVEIAERSGLPLTMLIKVGEPDEHRYWDEVLSRRLTPDVEVVQNADQATKVEALGRARGLLFPIDWDEPFGLVMIEALACGTPVVATRRGSVPEVVDHGTTGFLVDPDDRVAGSVEAVSHLDDLSPGECRSAVELRFSAPRMVAAYDRLFERLVPARRSTGQIAVQL